MNPPDDATRPSCASDRRGVWNFATLTLHQALLRTGWIFKTESVVMPLVLDSLGGTAWIRGALPMLNRLGQSLPPIFVAGWVARLGRKKFFLSFCSGLMAVVFLTLAGIWREFNRPAAWMQLIFLGLYLIFFVTVGLRQITYSTLIGKLVSVRRRGRLLSWANLIGGIGAISCAWFLIRPWLFRGVPSFTHIFFMAGALFGVAAVGGICLKEPVEPLPSQDSWPASPWREMFTTLVADRNLANLMVVAFLFGLSYSLFPHYQSLGRSRLNLSLPDLVPWMIAQNIGVTLFSFPFGWIADRFGNRVALMGLMLGSIAAPLLAIAITRQAGAGPWSYSLVFLLLGVMPVTMRIVNNYALELAEPAKQPLYVSLTNLALSCPAIGLSLLVGWMIDIVGFEVCFLAVALCLVLGFVLVLRVEEPRRQTFNPL